MWGFFLFPVWFQVSLINCISSHNCKGLGLLKLWCLTYSRLLTGFDMLVFFINVSLMEFQVRCLVLFLLFSVIDGFKWFSIESLHKSIQLMLEFLRVPFLVLHFFYYRFMTLLTMLSVILLSMLMILLSKCEQASDLWQQLESDL